MHRAALRTPSTASGRAGGPRTRPTTDASARRDDASSAALRGEIAISTTAEIAHVRAERDELQRALSAAERKLLQSERTHRAERERRQATGTALRQMEAKLAQATRHGAGAQLQQANLAAARLGERSAMQEEAATARELRRMQLVALPCLVAELRAAEAEAVLTAESWRETVEEEAGAALHAARQAVAEVEAERRASARTLEFEAEERALAEAAAWEREAALRATLQAAQDHAQAESQRAAALERSLADAEAAAGVQGPCRVRWLLPRLLLRRGLQGLGRVH